MKNRALYILCGIVFILCLMCSCASTSRVSVTEDLRMRLLPAEAIRESVDVYQLMEGTLPMYGEAVLESYLVADGTGIEMYLFAPTGQTIAVVHYDGKRAVMESEFIPHGDLAAAYMAFDVQMCYASAEDIERSGLSVSEETVDGGRARVISYGGTVLYRIVYSERTCSVDNVHRGYSYILEALDY